MSAKDAKPLAGSPPTSEASSDSEGSTDVIPHVALPKAALPKVSSSVSVIETPVDASKVKFGTTAAGPKESPAAEPPTKAAAAAPPTNLDAFWRQHPEFLWKPAVVAILLLAIQQLPPVARYLTRHGFAPLGVAKAWNYTLFAIGSSYAIHGWFCVHISHHEQLQPYDHGAATRYADRQGTLRVALRSCAALCTSWVLAFTPFAPPTASPLAFVGWSLFFYWYWDLHFYVIHRYAHNNRTVYKHVHKIHHTNTAPDCFGAYFVSYNSNFLLEQLVYMLMAFAGMPVNVFEWQLWLGTLDTFVKHSGHDLSEVKFPALPIRYKHYALALNPLVLLLGSCGTVEHDLHHEKFAPNYALMFTYLDRLFGSYEQGRVPGAVAAQQAAKFESEGRKGKVE